MIITPLIVITILLTIFYGCKKIKRKKVLLKQVEEKLTKKDNTGEFLNYLNIRRLQLSHSILDIKLTMYLIISICVSFLTTLFCLYMWYI